MKKLFNKFIVVILGGGLWIYYRLGFGGSRRDEIKQILDEAHKKLYGTSY